MFKLKGVLRKKIVVYHDPLSAKENVEMSILELTLYPLLCVVAVWFIFSMVIIVFS